MIVLTMNSKYEYGIITDNVLANEHNKRDSLNYQKTILLGQIVKIEAVLKSAYAVRLLKDGENWETVTYVCPGNVLMSVDEKLWPFLAAVVSPQERVKVVRDRPRCQRLLQITEEMVVGVSFPKDVCLGTVKYIGTVKGLGKCFGIQLHVKYQYYFVVIFMFTMYIAGKTRKKSM